MAVVGPGAVTQEDTDVKPALEGASEYEYVTILNPLTDDFAIKVAQDIPVNMPFNIGKDTSGKVNQITNNERDAAQVYGLNLKNPDFQTRKHIENSVIIRAGETINLKGNEAQVAVRQLVNEIAQRENKSRLLSDPTVRKEIESRIIKRRGSVQELMDNSLQTSRDQATHAINQSNEAQNEEEFPGFSQENPSPGTGTSYTPGDGEGKPKRVGRPRKTDS